MLHILGLSVYDRLGERLHVLLILAYRIAVVLLLRLRWVEVIQLCRLAKDATYLLAVQCFGIVVRAVHHTKQINRLLYAEIDSIEPSLVCPALI